MFFYFFLSCSLLQITLKTWWNNHFSTFECWSQNFQYYIFDLISLESIKAAGKGVEDLLKQSAQTAIDGVNKVVDDAKKSSEGLINAVKGIF